MRQPTPLHRSSEKLIRLLERQGIPSLNTFHTHPLTHSISASGLLPREAPSLLSKASFQKTSIPIPDLSRILFSRCKEVRLLISLKPVRCTVGDTAFLFNRSTYIGLCTAITHYGTVHSKLFGTRANTNARKRTHFYIKQRECTVNNQQLFLSKVTGFGQFIYPSSDIRFNTFKFVLRKIAHHNGDV